MSFLTKAVHSGQEVVNPGREPVLLTARRCAGALPTGSSPPAAYTTADGRALLGFCSGSRRYRRVLPPSLRRHEPVVPTDELAGTTRAADQGTTSGRSELEVRRTFEPGRLSATYLAAAYAQLVPVHQRRVRVSHVAESTAARVVAPDGAPLRASSEGRRS